METKVWRVEEFLCNLDCLYYKRHNKAILRRNFYEQENFSGIFFSKRYNCKSSEKVNEKLNLIYPRTVLQQGKMLNRGLPKADFKK